MTDTIVVFSVWASNTLKMRSWTTHVPVVGVWAWFRCDLAFPFWKDWHPLPQPVLVYLARAEDHRDERLKSQRGPSGRRCPPWWSRSAISLHKLPFKMRTRRRIIKCIQPQDWFAAIDLKDAYFHVSILLRHRLFLWFAFEGRAWQYRSSSSGSPCLPVCSRRS